MGRRRAETQETREEAAKQDGPYMDEETSLRVAHRLTEMGNFQL